jgi:hypothetical protein
MIIAFTLRARPGHEAEMKALIDDPQAAEAVAKAMGARRNLLLWHHDRAVRVLEFDAGVEPVPLFRLAQENGAIHAFLKRLGGLVEPSFDPDDESSFQAFSQASLMEVLFDVVPGPS